MEKPVADKGSREAKMKSLPVAARRMKLSRTPFGLISTGLHSVL
jgi:hypothetical protein